MTTGQPHILIVEDHPLFKEGIANLLQGMDTRFHITTANDGKEALEVLAKALVDLVITDIAMPRMNGVELSNHIKEDYPQVKLLVISVYANKTTLIQLMQIGANGFIKKDTERETVIDAIQCILQGGNFFPEEVTKEFMEEKHPKTLIDGPLTQLTKREIEILKLITKEYTTHEVASTLFISQHTVETHRKNMLRKLEVKNTIGLVKRAMELGFIDVN